MNKVETFQQFLVNAESIPIFEFGTNLFIAAILSYLIQQTYITCGRTVSSRIQLAFNFPMLILTTMLIITVVKSSLALSLGLVGALSIIRFRTAIKEPEELMYLFFCIAMGLGIGANQRLVSIVGMLFILAVIWTRHYVSGKRDNTRNMMVTISGSENNPLDLKTVTTILQQSCELVDIRRVEEVNNRIEVNFNVEFKGIDELNSFREKVKQLGDDISLVIFDNRGLI